MSCIFRSSNFMSCIFMPCNLVRQFHVLKFHVRHFQSTPLWRREVLLYMRNITWHMHWGEGSSKTIRSNFVPKLYIHQTPFIGLRWRLRVVCTWALCVKPVFGRKKNKSSQNLSQMAVFQKFKVLNVKYSYRDTENALPGRSDVFCVKIRSGWRVNCSLIEEPKTTNKKLSHPKARQYHVREQKPLNRSLQNFARRMLVVHDEITHASFSEARLRCFWCVEGSNFGLFHWLATGGTLFLAVLTATSHSIGNGQNSTLRRI